MDKIKAILKNSPLIIALTYILTGVLWIQFSDQFVLASFDDPQTITRIQSVKGWVFVLVSGLIIYFLVWKNNDLLGEVIEKIRVSRDKFEATFEHTPVGIAYNKPNEAWIQVNQTLCDMLGYTKDELLKINFSDFIHPDDLEKGRDLDKELIEKKRSSFKIEKRYRRKDGTYFPGLVSKTAVFNNEENTPYLIATLEDISAQKNTEEELRKTIREKEALLSEVHHRVRNNLALISALFDLQSMYIKDDRVDTILHDSQMRIKCLALVHESYVDAEKVAHIDFGNYLNELVEFVDNTFSHNGRTVPVKSNIPSLSLNINQAVPAGLLCNELMLNAYLNSFEDSDPAFIKVELEEGEDSLALVVSDNGKSRTEEYNLENPSSLGMLIIKTLCSQLNGELDIYTEGDTNFFKLLFQKRDLKGPSSTIS